MLHRELRFEDDPFAEFMRLGASCWGPRSHPPELGIKLKEQDREGLKERKEARLAEHLRKRTQRAAYTAAQRAIKLARIEANKKRRKNAQKETAATGSGATVTLSTRGRLQKKKKIHDV